jgi:hypothetical protein
MPAIKLFVATVQVFVGSNEALPGFWKSPVNTKAAEAEPAIASEALIIKTTRGIFIRLGGAWLR